MAGKKNMGKKRIRFVKILALCLIFMLGLTICGCTSGALAEEFDKETLEKVAKERINEALVQGAGSMVQNRLRKDFLEDYPVEDMQDNLLSLQSGKGEFLLFEKVSMRGEKSPKEGSDEDFAIVLVTANFEKGEILFTLTFDTDMNLVSFYAQ